MEHREPAPHGPAADQPVTHSSFIKPALCTVLDPAQFDHYLRAVLEIAKPRGELGRFWNQPRDGKPKAWGQLLLIGLMLAALAWLESR